MPRRLLMIAYYFPPDLDVGRMRTVKFCKYLPEHGWQPVVVAPRPRRDGDVAERSEIPPATEVHRTGTGLLLQRLMDVGAACKRRLRSVRPTGTGPGGAVASAGAGSAKPKLSSLLFWPDPQGAWFLPARRRAVSLARNCDAVYSSGWPMTCHLVARSVAKLFNLPWIMDNRDPWTVETNLYRLGPQRRLMEHLDRACVGTADYVINVTEARTRQYIADFDDLPAEKFFTLPNGFDPEDFEGLGRPAEGGPLVITYLGSLYGGRSPEPLLRAMASLREAGDLPTGAVRLQLIGGGARAYTDRAATMGIADSVAATPRVGQRQALDVLARSHVAVLLGGGQVDLNSVPTKVYEYLYLRKPILAILPGGHLWRMLSDAGVECLEHDDQAGIRRLLSEMISCHRAGRRLQPPPRPPALEPYTRRALTGKLAGLLERVNSLPKGR